MFSKWFSKLKNFGVEKAINALDNVEKPLGDKIEVIRYQFEKLDSYGIAKLIIDQVQDVLRAYFKLPPPLPIDKP